MSKSPKYLLCTLLSFVVISIAVIASDPSAPQSKSRGKFTPVFQKREPASNPTDLVVLVDHEKIVGWVSGKWRHRGEAVTIQLGDETFTSRIAADNTFVWRHHVSERQTATITFGDITRTEILEPAPTNKPAVFFVVDRPVYRPGQTLHFAGFLRRETRIGYFEPIPNQDVEVHVTSTSKNTKAASLQLVSDDFGRIAGEYTFQNADALDRYQLTIPEHAGSAEVQLAEFRKAKVRLKIDGELDDRNLTLKFQALDFLDKPVAGSKVRFTAQVVRNADDSVVHALSGKAFVYQGDSLLRLLSFDGTSDEQQLLAQAGEQFLPSRAARTTVVATFQGDALVSANGSGEHELTLERAWTKGGYSVVVEGVLTDYNGHEQRTSAVVSLGGKVTDCDLEMQIDKQLFEVGETIQLEIRPRDANDAPVTVAATVMAMKLSPAATPPVTGFNYGYYGYQVFNHRMYRGNLAGAWNQRWQLASQAEKSDADRTLVTATVVKDNVATLQLDEPGAYKLVCIAELPDGRKLKNEVGCIVRPVEQLPGLVLNLDREEFKSGEHLTGAIHCRFDHARVLLTLQDSTGVRFWKTYTLRNGVMPIDEALPAGLRYGCVVAVQYLEDAEHIHVASKLVRVEPTDQIVDVQVTTRELYEPGETVTLDIDVNRQEAVDLVVSVFDQSLLGVAADKSADIRDFFLADERVQQTASREILRRRLGQLTYKALVEHAEELLQDDRAFRESPDGAVVQQAVSYYRNSHTIYTHSLSTLLTTYGRNVGFDQALRDYWGLNWHYRVNMPEEANKPVTIYELLQHQHGNWRLLSHQVGDTVMLLEFNPEYIQQFQHLLAQGGSPLGAMGYGMQGAARADARFSANASFSLLSGNGFRSNISGQAFASHLPQQAVELIDVDTPGITVRRDFSDAAYWNARVRTNDRGRAVVQFKLPDSLTNWQVVVTAVSRKMHVGQARANFRTFKPIMVWPIVPRIFTEGDRVHLYASVHNRTAQEQQIEVTLKVENGTILNRSATTITVPAHGESPVYWQFQPGAAGFTQLLMSAKSAAGSDASLKRLPVAPLAVEQSVTAGGYTKNGCVLVTPSEVHLEESQLNITLVPSLLDDTVQSLDYLVEYPHGCVEQTMSRFLPAIMVKKTLDRANIANAALEEKLPGVVEAGIKRLLELQQADGGWGWHGGSQTHEMMTPYALFGLLQAEQAGYTIPNEAALQNGLNRLNQFIQALTAEQAADKIYCLSVWSLRHELTDEQWSFIAECLEQDRLSDYALALSLEMAAQARAKAGGDKQHEAARADLAERLAAALHRSAQRTEQIAFWTTANFSRWGNDPFEITAAVLKALSAHNPEDELIAPVLNYFAANKRGNRWNSTKDTAMIIYALCDYLATQDYSPGSKRVVTVRVNDGKPEKVELAAGQLPQLSLPVTELRHGENHIAIEGHAPGAMFRAVLTYWQRQQDIQPLEKGLRVARHFYLLDDAGKMLRELHPGDAVPRGAYLESRVVVKRVLNQSMQYVLVENPKPSTCEILPATDTRFDQSSTQAALREDKTQGVAYHHEQTGADILDRCVLHAELEGHFVVPPAQVELMYETQTRGHSGTFNNRVVTPADAVSRATAVSITSGS